MKIQFLFLIGFAFSVSLFSQNKTGIGNVSDNSGVIIPNAIVQISPSSDPTDIYEYVCDKNGNYTFDITSSDSEYIFNVLPSVHTLQFSHNKESIQLSNGNNEILFHNVKLKAGNGINFSVIDTGGNPVSEAKVMLYDTQCNWKIDSGRIAKAVYTDSNGQVEINSLLPIKYWFNIREGYRTNRFTINSTITAIDTSNITNITVVIRDLTQKEFYMCGLCDNKTWITDSMIVFGATLPYDADTKLLSDATWGDSNGRFGYWWFDSSETIMTYNYIDGTANGSIIDATNLSITDTTWVGDMLFNGLQVTYFMSVPFLDTIDLNISVQDATIYLNSNKEAIITTDDLFTNSSYCFTCNTTLSQYSFDINDIGDNEIYATIEDRCGNSAVDTFTITVIAPGSTAIDENTKSKIKIYPNPARDFAVIESMDDVIEKIEIYTITGKPVRNFLIDKMQYTINTSDLIQGMYFLSIYGKNGIVIKKIIVD